MIGPVNEAWWHGKSPDVDGEVFLVFLEVSRIISGYLTVGDYRLNSVLVELHTSLLSLCHPPTAPWRKSTYNLFALPRHVVLSDFGQ
jgi:hypothetical protein